MQCNIENRQINLPDFLVVGTGKAGTSSLHYYLKEHPQIVLPGKTKETLFFHITTNPNKTQLKYLKNAITTFEEYALQFEGAGKKQVCGEICPSYLYFHDHTIKNLKKYHPGWREVKIIIILREPVDKIISHYHFVTNTLKIQDPSLEEALALESERIKRNDTLVDLLYMDNTRYYRQVKAYLDVFPQVEVYFYEDFKKDPKSFIQRILSFLEVNNSFEPANLGKKYNASSRRKLAKSKTIERVYRSGKKLIPGKLKKTFGSSLNNKISDFIYEEETIPQATRQQLKETFYPEIKKLEILLGKDLSFWGY